MPSIDLINMPSAWRLSQASNLLSPTSPVQLSSIPADVTAAENMQRFRFIAYESNPGALIAGLALRVDNGIGVGHVLTLSGNGVSITLTSSATPSFGEFFTPASGTPANKNLTARSIAFELQSSLAFMNSYNVFCEDNTIFISAKDFGSQYDLTVVASPANLTTVVNQAGQSRFAFNNLLDYSAFVQVYTSNGQFQYGVSMDRQEFDMAFEFDVPFSDSFFDIDTHAITKNYVDCELPTKKLNAGYNFTLLDTKALQAGRPPILRPYFVLYGDSYRFVTNGSKKRFVEGVSKILWRQNAAQHLLNPYNLNDYTWFPQLSSPFKFLTDSPSEEIPVDYSSHQYLQVIFRKHQKATGAYRINCLITFYDGTTLLTSLGNQSYFTLSNNVSWDVSPNVFNLESIETTEGKLIDKYEVQIQWTSEPSGPVRFSESKTYRFRRVCVESKTNLLWFNKFGGWDSLEFIGIQAKTRARTLSEIDRALPFDANKPSAISTELNLLNRIESRDAIQINSGLLSASLYEWLKDITLSTSVFAWDSTLSKYISYVIDESDYQFNSDSTEFNLQLTLRPIDNPTVSR